MLSDVPYNQRKSELELSRPALITSNNLAKKNKKYELNFTNKRNDAPEMYNLADSYKKRILNVQQSMPDYNTYRDKQEDEYER